MSFRKVAVASVFVLAPVRLASAQDHQDRMARSYDHIHFAVPDPRAAQDWYAQHLNGVLGESPDRLTFGGMPWKGTPPLPVQLTWMKLNGTPKPVRGNPILGLGFSYPDVDAKVKELRAAGVTIVTEPHDVPGVWREAVIEDPWGVRLELVQDPELIGFHHVALRAADPAASLDWYAREFGGDRTKIKGKVDAVRYGNMYVVIRQGPDEPLEPGYGINHIGFAVNGIDASAVRLKADGVRFSLEPREKLNQYGHRIAYVVGPSDVKIELVQHITCILREGAGPSAGYQ